MRIALSSVGVPVHRVQASLVCQMPTSGRDNIIGKLNREPVANVTSDAALFPPIEPSGLLPQALSPLLRALLSTDRTLWVSRRVSSFEMADRRYSSITFAYVWR